MGRKIHTNSVDEALLRWYIRPSHFRTDTGDVINLGGEREILPVHDLTIFGDLSKVLETNKGNWIYQHLENVASNEIAEIYALHSNYPRFKSLEFVKEMILNSQRIVNINRKKFNYISKLHAVAYFEDDKLHIVDLGARNGTYIDDQLLQAFDPQMLSDRNIISLGGRIGNGVTFKTYNPLKRISAVLVGVDYKGKREDVFERDVHEIDRLFKMSNVNYSSTKLLGRKATHKKVFNSISAHDDLSKDSVFFLYFSCHGGKFNLDLYGSDLIRKKKLERALSKIPATKLVIVDACHAGEGWSNIDVDNTFFMFSSEYGTSYHSKGMGNYTKEFVRKLTSLLDRNQPVDFKRFNITPRGLNYQQPVNEGLVSIII